MALCSASKPRSRLPEPLVAVPLSRNKIITPIGLQKLNLSALLKPALRSRRIPRTGDGGDDDDDRDQAAGPVGTVLCRAGVVVVVPGLVPTGGQVTPRPSPA